MADAGGDLAKRVADGYFRCVSGADDTTKTPGHMIGPFEVASAFMEDPAAARQPVVP